MHLRELKDKSPKDLLNWAEDLGIEDASSMRVQDLVFAIMKKIASFLAVLLTFSLFSCGTDVPAETVSETESVTESASKTETKTETESEVETESESASSGSQGGNQMQETESQTETETQKKTPDAPSGNNNADKGTQKGGCGSSIGAGAVSLVAVISLAGFAIKKKKVG